jgi:peptidoglycan/xylan/chitin deacetylase (PgdA/CDA1 family)
MTARAAGATATATIVMYHVVRPARGLAARLKGLDLGAFRDQLSYIHAHYTPVGLFDLVDAAGDPHALPPRPVVLTFDDGYAGHWDLVCPLLLRTRTPAAFFPVAASTLDARVLDVNKIQLILAAADLDTIISAIDSAIDREAARGGESREQYRARWWRTSRWDPPEVVYVKRLLQHGLPERVRRPLVDDLFCRLVSADEQAVAAELYLTRDQLGEMRRAGMTIGAHGDRHVRLSTLSREQQASEIDGALRVLDAVDAPRRHFAYCYANGDYNADSIELLRAHECRVALTTHPEVVRIGVDSLLALPRIDTNDLPSAGSA